MVSDGLGPQMVYPTAPPDPGKVWMGNPSNTAWKQVPVNLVLEGKKRGYRVVQPMQAAHAPERVQPSLANMADRRMAAQTMPLPIVGSQGAGAPSIMEAGTGVLNQAPLVGMMLGGAPGAGIGEAVRQGGYAALGIPTENPLGQMALQTGLGGLFAGVGPFPGVGRLAGRATNAAMQGLGNRMMETAIKPPQWVEEQALSRPAPSRKAPEGAKKSFELVKEAGLSPGKQAEGVYGTTLAGQRGAQLHEAVVKLVDRVAKRRARAGRPLVYEPRKVFGQMFKDAVKETQATIPDPKAGAEIIAARKAFMLEHAGLGNKTMTVQEMWDMGAKAQDNAAKAIDAAERSGVPVQSLPLGERVRLKLEAQLSEDVNRVLRRDVPGFQAAQQKVQSNMLAKYALLNTEKQGARPMMSWRGGPDVHLIPDPGAEFRAGRALENPANRAAWAGGVQGATGTIPPAVLMQLLGQINRSRALNRPRTAPDSLGGGS